jgi:PKD repeat protein
MKKVLFTLLISCGIVASSVAQTHKCGTDEVMEEAFKNDPGLKIRMAESEKELQKKLADKKNQKTTNDYEKQIVPVVIHIIHKYGSDNVTEAQCLDAIRILNEDFQRRGADSTQIASAFFPIRGNTNMEFRLAKIDPNGNCTNGITRTYSLLTDNAGNNVKDLISWDTKKYFNIWVANNVYSGTNQVGGFAYYPCSAPQARYEGVIVTHRQFGSIGTSGGNFSARTLPHEVGHAMNLPHTWGSSNTPGQASNCDLDDGVADTPNTIGSSGCNLSQVTCGTLDNVNNIMDYSNCARMFTEGQSDRMRIAADTNSNCQFRRDLSKMTNLIATGVVDGYVANCAPKADFNVVSRQVCQGSTVSFSDVSYNATVTSRNWFFDGGTPQISTDQTVNVIYPAPGKYTVKLVVSNQYGADSLIRTQIIDVVPSPGVFMAPYFEGIENASWPANNASNELENWYEETTTSNNWERTTVAAATGDASARIRLSLIQSGRVNSFISPVLDFTNISATNHRLTFKVAYAQRTSSGTGSNDQLKLLISTNCGQTWTSRYNKSGATLSTTGGTLGGSSFVPNADQWRTETVSLSGLAGRTAIIMKFECTSNQGSVMYVDDINIFSIVTGINGDDLADELQFGIYPNPSDVDATIYFELPTATNVTIDVKDVLGRTIGNFAENKSAGSHQYTFSDLAGNVSTGVYFIKFTTEQGTFTKKFIKN